MNYTCWVLEACRSHKTLTITLWLKKSQNTVCLKQDHCTLHCHNLQNCSTHFRDYFGTISLMKRRNTRAAQSGFTTQTQDSEEENYVAGGSDEENDPDGVVDENSDESSGENENNENTTDQSEETETWIPETAEDFPEYPNIPRFNGPKFEPKSTHSRKIFNLINADKFSPLQWFLEYLSVSFWLQIIEFTNNHAQDDPEWEILSISELWIFLAILFLIAIKSPPSYRYLWKTDWKYECPKIKKLGMTVRRFELIRKHLKFHNGEEDTNDAYWRVRAIVDELRANCKRILKPPENLSLDEMSPAFKGRTRLTISMRNKKSKKIST